jgi:hypothetical protein
MPAVPTQRWLESFRLAVESIPPNAQPAADASADFDPPAPPLPPPTPARAAQAQPALVGQAQAVHERLMSSLAILRRKRALVAAGGAASRAGWLLGTADDAVGTDGCVVTRTFLMEVGTLGSVCVCGSMRVCMFG